jgi:transcription initiation factor TFIID subunit TAF12
MDDLKTAARNAKQRLKSDFWYKCKSEVEASAIEAREKGLNERKVKEQLYERVKESLKGDEPDQFYLKVKQLLDTYGEVSDAIGRLTDRAYYETLSYEERQRYTLELSAKYLKAVDKYKREKAMDF